MPAPDWPSAPFPQYPLQNSVKEVGPKVVIRSPTDAGPAKVRKRYTANPRAFSVGLLLTRAQVEELDSFFYDSCAGGATVFAWYHPRKYDDGGGKVDMIFTAEPKYAIASGEEKWLATLAIEVQP